MIFRRCFQSLRSWGWPLLIVLAVLSFFTFHHFLTQPRVSYDEAINIMLGRSLAESGTIAMPIAPGIFSINSFRNNASSGWVLAASLAGAFRAFGTTFFVTRIVMALYLFGFTISLFFLLRRWVGARSATLGSLLVVTFASFYGSGKMALGEIPSLLWLALAFLWVERFAAHPMKRAIGSGLGFGLFFATKLTYALIGAPVLFVIHLVRVVRKQEPVKSFLVFWGIAAVVVAPTLWYASIHPLNPSNILKTISYISNNYNSPCVSCDALNNLHLFLTHSTFWHLELLLALAILYFIRFPSALRDWRVLWAIIYSALTVVYFIKSPGTIRYLIHVQIFLLAFAPAMTFALIEKWKSTWRRVGLGLIVGLVCVQAIHTYAFADLLYLDAHLALAKYLQDDLPRDGLIGVIHAPVAAAAVPSNRLIQFIAMNHRPDGINPLAGPVDQLPRFLIYSDGSDSLEYVTPSEDVLNQYYQQRVVFGHSTFVLMERKDQATGTSSM